MKKITKIILLAVVIFFISAFSVFALYFMGQAPIPGGIAWGVDFSQMQAESLGLDWKEAYSAIITDLKAKNIKLHTQWDWVEGSRDDYFFDDIDWQISEAKKNKTQIIYVVGMKTGRWPECHIPGWAEDLPKEEQQAEILEYIKEAVLRYKQADIISYWQVENEPLFDFGKCPWYDKEFLKKEVELVKALDPSRKIIISDSGEQSNWFEAAVIGDVVGITMYREVWMHITDKFGFNVKSFLPPITYWRKAMLVDKLFNKKVLCIELQAEPWASEPFSTLTLEDQKKTMNLDIFKENVKFAKETGLDTFYFWGVEWWYWLKETQNDPGIWNEAKALFKN